MTLVSHINSQENEKKPLITVMDFAYSGVSEMETQVLVDFLSSYIMETGRFRVLDRIQREKLLNELEFSLSGTIDEDYELSIGKMLQAKLIIVGSVGAVGTRYILNMKLIDVETGETLQTASEKYRNMDSLVDGSEKLVESFLVLQEENPVQTVQSPETSEIHKDSEISDESDKPKEPPLSSPELLNRPLMKISKHSLEVCIEVYNVAFDGGNTAYLAFETGYTYKLTDKWYIGGWLGGAWGEDMPEDLLLFPLGGIKGIYGDKEDGFALSLNLGLPPSIGLYYRNFFLQLGLAEPASLLIPSYYGADTSEISILGGGLGYSLNL